MGALHAGHAALVARAREECASVAASVFVNPLQFGPGEDFERYPRPLEEDSRLLAEGGVALLYAPEPAAMYPPGFSCAIDAGPLGEVFEGAVRPGHFRGVATVVAKLFHTLEPDAAYFGQKDAQQLAVIRRLVRDLDFALRVAVCPTVREPDGLALSSRNAYLTASERAGASSLYRALAAAKAAADEGVVSCAEMLERGRRELEPPLVEEYLAVVDPETFARLATLVRPALVIGVARAGVTRLLDNIELA
jgi:pantoate--beta-alanine ligase